MKVRSSSTNANRQRVRPGCAKIEEENAGDLTPEKIARLEHEASQKAENDKLLVDEDRLSYRRSSLHPGLTLDRPSGRPSMWRCSGRWSLPVLDDQRLFDDPYAAAFLDGKLKLGTRLAGSRFGQRLVCHYIDRNWPGSRPSVVIRTRLIDDAVTAAIDDGAEQLAILGAGYDTRGMRLEAAASVPGVRARPAANPGSQEGQTDQRGMAHCRRTSSYVPFDLLEEGVGAPLERAGFRSGSQVGLRLGGSAELPDSGSSGPDPRLGCARAGRREAESSSPTSTSRCSKGTRRATPSHHGPRRSRRWGSLSGTESTTGRWTSSSLNGASSSCGTCRPRRLSSGTRFTGGEAAPDFYRVAEAEVLPGR